MKDSIKHSPEAIDRPISLLNGLSKIESGKVYEVIPKDNLNTYQRPPSKKNLILIITQSVLINDELHRMAFFKDVTFGVLYE